MLPVWRRNCATGAVFVRGDVAEAISCFPTGGRRHHTGPRRHAAAAAGPLAGSARRVEHGA